MPKGPPGALIPASFPCCASLAAVGPSGAAVVDGAGDHVPDGPPRSQQPPATSGGGLAAPQRQGQDEHLSGGLDPVAWGVEGGVSSPVRHGSNYHFPPVPPAQATGASSRADRPAAGAVLPAGSTADGLLLGSDLPRGRLGRATALERVKPAGSQRPVPAAGWGWLSSWASAA
jgi:hypothetical protein